MVAQFPTLVRDELILDQQLIDRIDPPGQTPTTVPNSPFVFTARRVVLAGATIRDRDVEIYADEIADGPGLGDRAGLTLHASGLPASGANGAPGKSLTIFTRSIGVASAVSRGQTGGPGPVGKPGQDLDCGSLPLLPDTTPGVRPEPIDPLPLPEKGVTGGQGGTGGKGGPGGKIVVNTVQAAPPGAANRLRGEGGFAGAKGQGGPGGKGCPRPNPGDQGPEGGTLGRGDDVPGVVTTVTEATLVAQIQARVVGFPWAQVRTEAADVAVRTGKTVVADTELDRAAQLQAPATRAAMLRRRLRHALTPAGVERDVDVRPAIEKHRADWKTAVDAYNAAVLRGGVSMFRSISREGLLAAHDQLKADHQKMIDNDLQAQTNERDERVSSVADARTNLSGLIPEAAERIRVLVEDLEVPPGITVAVGVVLDARVVAERIRTLLADESGQAPDSRHLLVTDLDLLTADAENDSYPGPGSFLLAVLRGRAAGLAGADLTDPNPTVPRSWANPNVVVSFRAVKTALRAAAGDARLRNELAELTELAQRSRLLQLRELQAAEGALIQQFVRDQAESTQFNLQQDPNTLSTEGIAVNHLDAARDFADVFAWRAHASERATTLFTLDSVFPGSVYPESSVSAAAANAEQLFHPDRREELREHLGFPGPQLTVGQVSTTEHDPQLFLTSYSKRGTFVKGRGDSAVDPLTFDSGERPEILARLKTDRNAWFEATLDDLANLSGSRFESKVVGVGLVFEGMSTTNDDPDPVDSMVIRVEHSGISSQRRMDGAVIPQYLLPGEVEVTVHRQRTGTGGPFTNTWKGFMRFDETPSPDGETPGQTVGKPEDFPLWGRGAAAGWRVRFANPALPRLNTLTKFELEVEYDSFAKPGQISMRRIDQPLGALTPGRTVQARAVLTGPAPAGGLKLTLSSDNPAALSVPAAVLVPAGSASVEIPVTVLAASGATPVRLRATTPDGFTRRVLATVPAASPTAPPTVIRISVRTPDEETGVVNGIALAGDRLVAAYNPSIIDPDGTIRPNGPGGMISMAISAAGMSGPQRFVLGHQPRAIAVGNGKAYLVNGDPAFYSLSVIDLATNKQIAETHIGFGPVRVAVDAAANLVYVSNWGQRTVEVFHGTTGAKVATIPGIRGPQGLAIDAKRRRVYVAASFRSNGPDDVENGLAVITRSAAGVHALDRIVPIEGETQPLDVAFDSQRDLIHVANLGGGPFHPGITTFRARDLTQLAFLRVPGPVLSCDVHLATGAVVSGGPSPLVHVVDGTNQRYVTSHKVLTNVQTVAVHQATGVIFAGDRVTGEIARLAPVPVAQTSWR